MAFLPEAHEAASAVLANCQDLDVCKDWADRAAALASYAKQVNDDTLLRMAARIKARAVRRSGELLQQIQPAKNQHDASARAGDHPSSRSEAASDAGMSEHQQKAALRVAAIPADDFERQVEGTNPPTLTALAQQGIKPRPLLDLKGRDHPGPGLLVHAARDETARTFLTPLPLTEASCLGGVMALTA